MRLRADSWGGFLLRAALAAVVLAVLVWMGVRLMPSQCLRLSLVALFAMSVACGAFLPKRGNGATGSPSAQPGAQPAEPGSVPQQVPEPEPASQPQSEIRPQPEHEHSTSVAGEDDYCRARAMKHQEIPDFRVDGLYLDLLGESAEKGYARAMAKLGDYAMRRGTWVEAYYWMWCAQRAGQADVAAALREIQRNWTQDGCRSEKQNVNDLFDKERGSIGRALLGIVTNRNADAAREYLRTNHPEFL